MTDTLRETTNTNSAAQMNYAAIIWGVGVLCVLVLALCMRVDGARVFLPGIATPLPEMCMTSSQLGIDCPGCGLTRSFIYLAHGELRAAWELNWTSTLLFVYLVAQLPLALTHWVLGADGRQVGWFSRMIWWNERLIVVCAAMVFLRWIARLVIGDLV